MSEHTFPSRVKCDSRKIIVTRLQKSCQERSIEIGVVVDNLHVAAGSAPSPEREPSAFEAEKHKLRKKDRMLAVGK